MMNFTKTKKKYMERKTRGRISLVVRCSMYWGKGHTSFGVMGTLVHLPCSPTASDGPARLTSESGNEWGVGQLGC
jgi:hypothetical protein